jgi:hypothetical protein
MQATDRPDILKARQLRAQGEQARQHCAREVKAIREELVRVRTTRAVGHKRIHLV